VKTIVRFQHFCCAANVRSNIYADSAPAATDSTADALNRLVWDFCFSADRDETGLPENLKIFGIHMVWDLESHSIVNTAEAEILLLLWGGMTRKNKEILRKLAPLRDKARAVVRDRLMHGSGLPSTKPAFGFVGQDAMRAEFLVEEITGMLEVPKDVLVYDEPFNAILNVTFDDLGGKAAIPANLPDDVDISECCAPFSDDLLNLLVVVCEQAPWDGPMALDPALPDTEEGWRKLVMQMDLTRFVKFFAPMVSMTRSYSRSLPINPDEK
jgi:hypothetical protein